MVKVKHDLTGMKFGRLTVVSQVEDYITPKNGKHHAMWNVYCSCNPNKIYTVRQAGLFSGKTKSCGCLQKEKVASRKGQKYDYKRRKFNTYKLDGEYGIGFTENGMEFYFDLEDYNKIKNYYWWVDSRDGYVIAYINNKAIQQHRLILNLFDEKLVIDHINHNKNDNRKEFLRICKCVENARNLNVSKNNTTGVTGVYYLKDKNRWMARIQFNKKIINLGYFVNYIDAVKARLDGQKKYFGEFANNEYIENLIKDYENNKLTN